MRHCLYPQVDNSKENFIGFHSCILLHIKFWLDRFYVIVNHLLNRFSVIVNHLCVLSVCVPEIRTSFWKPKWVFMEADFLIQYSVWLPYIRIRFYEFSVTRFRRFLGQWQTNVYCYQCELGLMYSLICQCWSGERKREREEREKERDMTASN